MNSNRHLVRAALVMGTRIVILQKYIPLLEIHADKLGAN